MMTDWNKQKVPELRAELKKRGLPQNGLKADLVARLTAADSESGFESEATIKGDPHEVVTDSNSPVDGAAEVKVSPNNDHPEEPIALSQSSHGTGLSLPLPNNSAAGEVYVSRSPPVERNQPSELATDVSQSTVAGVEHSPHLPIVDTEELIDDKQKRKRRSQTPPPSATDIRRKRLRAEEEIIKSPLSSGDLGGEIATTKADANWVENHNAVDIDMVNNGSEMISDTQAYGEFGRVTMDVVEEKATTEHKQDSETEFGGPKSQDLNAADLPLNDILSHKKKDSRFKDLVSAQTSKSTQESKVDDQDNQSTDRSVAPSIHPATSALYIRHFMRPLNASALKEHLTTLATAPNTIRDPDIVTDFYIDPIRTHAFISFKSTSAAARVRSELHDQIWPEERTRKPLWADFIPAQRVADWIAEEQSSSAGSRSGGKKWEVVYNTDDKGIITATLQEAGNSAPLARKPSVAMAPPAVPARFGTERAPSGPRAQNYGGAPPPSEGPSLDQLFRYTNARPALYYQPVSKDLAERRLDHIEDVTSKHYSPHVVGSEINRYTFEDGDALVDRGPEIFSGIRRPATERGRVGGGAGGMGRGGRGRGEGGYRYRGGDRYEGSGQNRDFRDRGLSYRRY